MKESVYRKLETLVERYEEVQALLSDPDVISDQDRFRALSKEYSELEEVTKAFNAYRQAEDDVVTAEEMLKDNDPDMREMAQEEYKEAKANIEKLEDELQVLMLPKDPRDNNNVFLFEYKDLILADAVKQSDDCEKIKNEISYIIIIFKFANNILPRR